MERSDKSGSKTQKILLSRNPFGGHARDSNPASYDGKQGRSEHFEKEILDKTPFVML